MTKSRFINYIQSIFRKLRHRDPYEIRLYAHMLIEDIYIGILPYDDHDKPSFTVKLEGGTRQNEMELCEAIERHTRQDLKEGLTDFIRETAKGLVYNGRVYYRILYTGERENRFDLVRLYREDMFSLFGWHVTLRKPNRRRDANQGSRLGKIICFQLPTEFQYIPRLIKKMSKVDPSGLPNFAMNQYHLECPKSERVPVDFNVIRQAEERRLGKMTRQIGWTGRRLLNEKMTEFYYLRLELIFKRFLIKLKDSIIADLNRLLKQLSKDIEFPSSVLVDGLPTEQDITESEKKLVNGTAPFSEVMKPFRLQSA